MDAIEQEIQDAKFELSYAIGKSGWSKGSLEYKAAEYIEDCGINDSEFENFFEWALRDPASVGFKMAKIADKHLETFVAYHLTEIQQRFCIGPFKEREE